jgi:uncharacterized protein YqeY
MSTVKEKMSADLKDAMKSGDIQKKEALRFLTAAIKQIEIDTRETLSDERIYSILQTESKKRREAMEEYTKVGRMDMVEQQHYEIALITTYLPQQLTEDELKAEVAKAIEESGAKSAKDQGVVMKILLPRVKDRAPGKVINDTVQAQLKALGS